MVNKLGRDDVRSTTGTCRPARLDPRLVMPSAARKLSAVNVISVAGLNLLNHHYVPFLAIAILAMEVIIRPGDPRSNATDTR